MPVTPNPPARLKQIHARLVRHFGPLHWWPAETPFEMAVGAILTQNTAWRNVERAIAQLRQSAALTPEALLRLPRARLEELIRPAGFFRQKAERLQLLARHLDRCHGGELSALLAQPLAKARSELLALKGIGPETADSILLYAGHRPTFVIDAYTRRLFARLGLIHGTEGYETLRRLFLERLPPDPGLFNAYHALIVEQCKTFCRKRRPLCPDCPLAALCPRVGLAS